MSALKGEWENAVSESKMDSVQEETLAVSVAIVVDNRHNRPLLLPKRRHRMTEEDLRQTVPR